MSCFTGKHIRGSSAHHCPCSRHSLIAETRPNPVRPLPAATAYCYSLYSKVDAVPSGHATCYYKCAKQLAQELRLLATVRCELADVALPWGPASTHIYPICFMPRGLQLCPILVGEGGQVSPLVAWASSCCSISCSRDTTWGADSGDGAGVRGFSTEVECMNEQVHNHLLQVKSATAPTHVPTLAADPMCCVV